MFKLIAMGALVVSASAAQGQALAHYREFQLGATMASVAALAGVATSEAQTVHARPALLQELQWRRPYARLGETVIDPVRQIAFGFYNDQLYRLVIDYDRDRTEGMTDLDMIEAISVMYGPQVKAMARANRPPVEVIDAGSGTRVAGWGNAEYEAVLYRSSSYGSGFRMVVTSVRLSALARTAEAQALQLDAREAPERERARLRKADADAQTAQDKARLVNKPGFRP